MTKIELDPDLRSVERINGFNATAWSYIATIAMADTPQSQQWLINHGDY